MRRREATSSPGHRMDLHRFVADYLDAWNRQDVECLMGFLDKRATYYDAFWMEYCSGRDLARYLQHFFDDEPIWYTLSGELIAIDNGVIFRYIAHERAGSGPGAELFPGAEILNLREGKVVAISDFYCQPDEHSLQEIAGVVGQRRAEPYRIRYGLGSRRLTRLGDRLAQVMRKDRVFLDPELSQGALAAIVGCSVDELVQVLGDRYGAEIHVVVEQYRVAHARELLQQGFGEANLLARTAKQSGFKSLEHFDAAFRRRTGETPERFLDRCRSREQRE